MRTFLFPLVVVSSCAAIAPALALQATDTMQVWKKATEAERSTLLEQLLGKSAAGGAAVAKCMDATSTTPGHADLPIAEVAKACASVGKSEQPV